jgi:transcriptional regulator with XRE-family HTH domain
MMSDNGSTVDALVGGPAARPAAPWIIPDPSDRTASARKERYEILAEWSLIPRLERAMFGMPTTQTELADLLGVSVGAISQWKKTPQFNRIMSTRLRAHYGAERLASVIDNLHEIALGSSPQAVSAAKTLITYVQGAEGQAVNPHEELEDLTDEELAALAESLDRIQKNTQRA